jgi:hypothetical protein
MEAETGGEYRVTYTEGPHLKFNRELTKRDYIALCESLSRTFNETFRVTDPVAKYVFHPDSVTEGGFFLFNFPDKRGEMYKCMRHHLYAPTKGGAPPPPSWPFIEDQETVTHDWTQASDQTLVPQATVAYTTLKAFYGAPVWTLQELNICKMVLARYDVKLTRMPKKQDLSRDRSLYT